MDSWFRYVFFRGCVKAGLSPIGLNLTFWTGGDAQIRAIKVIMGLKVTSNHSISAKRHGQKNTYLN